MYSSIQGQTKHRSIQPMLGLSNLNDHSSCSALTFWTAPVLSSGRHNNLSNPTQQTQSASCAHFGRRRSFFFSAKLCISFQISYYSLTGRSHKAIFFFFFIPFISTIHFRGKSKEPPFYSTANGDTINLAFIREFLKCRGTTRILYGCLGPEKAWSCWSKPRCPNIVVTQFEKQTMRNNRR